MIKQNRDVRSLTDFKCHTKDIVRQIRATGTPAALTINGKPELIIQDVESYERLLNRLDQIEAIAGICRGLAQVEQGEGRPAEEVFEEFRLQHGIATG